MNLNLSQKITLSTMLVASGFILFASVYLFSDMSKKIKEDHIKLAEHKLELRVKHFKQRMEVAKKDLALISRHPVVQKALLNQLQEKGIKKRKLPPSKLTKNTYHFLESLLATQSLYFQVRLLNSHGQELIRIERDKTGKIFTKLDNELQDKSKEPYFQRLKDHFPNFDTEKPGSNSHFSSVSLNREHGKISLPVRPTIRALKPIFIDQQLAGLAVINIDFNALIHKLLRDDDPSETFVADQEGNYLFHSHKERAFSHLLTGRNGQLFEELALSREAWNSSEKEYRSLDSDDFIIVTRRIPLSKQPSEDLIFAVSTDKELVLTSVKDLLKKVLTFLFLLITAMAITVYFSTKAVVQPILNLTQKAKDYSDGKIADFQGILSQDEVGDLTKAFARMIDVIGAKEFNLRVVNQELEKKVEARTTALRRSDRIMKSILNHAPSAIYLKDENGRFIYINKAFELMFGVTQVDVIGRTDEETFHQETAHFFTSKETLTKLTGAQQSFDGTVVTDIGRFSLISTVFPIENQDYRDGEIMCGILFDITDKELVDKQIEEERAKSIANSQLATLGEMAGGMAHEINNPLAIISGTATQAKRILQNQPDKVDILVGFLEKIEQTTNRIAKIIKGLRSFSRNADEDPLVPSQIPVIVEDTLELASSKIKQSQVKFTVSEVPEIIADCREAQIGQVLLNLINNAVDAVKELEMEERWLHFDVSEDEKNVIFKISNGGPLIPVKVRRKILQPFFTTKPIGKGTGLGLSISVGIIEEHAGRLFLNEEAENTTFEVHLPKVRAGEDNSAA